MTLNSLGLSTRLITAIRSPSFTAQSIATLTVLHLVMTEETCNKVAEAGALEVVVNELQNVRIFFPKDLLVKLGSPK